MAKPLVIAAIFVALISTIALEIWNISGQRFWVFSGLLVLVAQTSFLFYALVGDRYAMVVAGRRIFDWLFALVFPATITLCAIACLVLIYGLVFLAPPGPCGEICIP